VGHEVVRRDLREVGSALGRAHVISSVIIVTLLVFLAAAATGTAVGPGDDRGG
jgi:hypothetical protein